MKRQLDKYLNVPVRLVVRLGLAPANLALLETVGRRTGRRHLTPVGIGFVGDVGWLVAEHGSHSDYVRNLMAEPRVRVSTRQGWRTGVAVPLPDDDARARRRTIDAMHGLIGRIDGYVFRAKATDPLTVRVDLDPAEGGH